MAQRAYLQMDQGTDFSAELEIVSYYNMKSYNLSDATVTAQMRKSWQSTIAYDFEVFITDVNGIILLAMPHELTSTIEAGRYVYDVVVTHANNNQRYRIIEGIMTCNPGVTR